MAIKSLSFIIISALLVASSSLSGVSAVVVGGRKALASNANAVAVLPDFVPLDRKDPKMIELAKCAIDEYNKQNKSKLVYSSVFEAIYTKCKEGINYGLIVAANDDNKKLNFYDIKMLVCENAKKVTAFHKM